MDRLDHIAFDSDDDDRLDDTISPLEPGGDEVIPLPSESGAALGQLGCLLFASFLMFAVVAYATNCLADALVPVVK